MRGNPKCAKTLVSLKKVIAEICSPSSVSTTSPHGRATGAWVVDVEAEGGLAVGAGRDDAPRGAAHARPMLEEEGDGRLPLVLERVRRHRHPGVVGEQGDHSFRVSALERFHEAADELAFLRRVRERRTRGVDSSLGERCACALERPLDGGFSGFQDRRAFVGREPEDVAQHEGGALQRRQPLQTGDER